MMIVLGTKTLRSMTNINTMKGVRWVTTTSTSATPILNAFVLLIKIILSTSMMMGITTIDAIRIIPSEWSVTSISNNTNTNRRREQYRRVKQLVSNPVYVEVPKSPDEHLVESIPLLDPSTFTTKHWAGHLPVSSNGDKYFFYWLFAPDMKGNTGTKAIADGDIPIIIWLNGGPACSSMDGLFIENGPFRFEVNPQSGQYQLVPNEYSWHKVPAYTLYIDQPVGTGLSFTTSEIYPTNDHEVNVDFYYFLQQFFALHADKFVNNDSKEVSRKLYFSGESYAGHYIPSLMNYLLQRKSNPKTAKRDPTEITISVNGAAIGNGWTDPFYQYAGADFAYGHGLIGSAQVTTLHEKEKACQSQLNKGIYSVGICFDLIDDIIDASFGSGSPYKASGYDVRVSELRGAAREFPPGHKIIETYLGGWDAPVNAKGKISNTIYKTVLEAVHATAATAAGQSYLECTDPPYNALAGNDGKGVVDDVIGVLKHTDNVQLLFFNGIHDIICNHVGNEKYLQKLPWEHAINWYQADRYAWVGDTEQPGRVSGYMKEYQNLKYLKIMDAGHMVPMDVPNVALDMMKLFVLNGSFNAHKQQLVATIDDTASCPTCPTCLERDSGSALPTTNDSGSENRNGMVSISYWWIVSSAGIIVFGGIYIIMTSTRRKTTTIATHQRIPQYELELRDTTAASSSISSSYHDDENGHTIT
jgi:carboxypeptidase D